jgi:hypothetical protein
MGLRVPHSLVQFTLNQLYELLQNFYTVLFLRLLPILVHLTIKYMLRCRSSRIFKRRYVFKSLPSKLSLIQTHPEVYGLVLFVLNLYSSSLSLHVYQYTLHLLQWLTIYLQYVLLSLDDFAILNHVGSYGH